MNCEVICKWYEGSSVIKSERYAVEVGKNSTYAFGDKMCHVTIEWEANKNGMR